MDTFSIALRLFIRASCYCTGASATASADCRVVRAGEAAPADRWRCSVSLWAGDGGPSCGAVPLILARDFSQRIARTKCNNGMCLHGVCLYIVRNVTYTITNNLFWVKRQIYV